MGKEKIIFAKLFDYDEHQVLITKTNKQENDSKHELLFRIEFEHYTSEVTLGFPDEVQRDIAFNAFDHEKSKEYLETICDLHNIN